MSLVATALRRIDPSAFRIDRARRRRAAGRPAAERRDHLRDDRDRQRRGLRRPPARRRRRAHRRRRRDPRARTDAAAGLPRRAPSRSPTAGWRPATSGRWLDDGRLHVDGRRGDLIITGGENVWPEPVEAVLRRHRPATSPTSPCRRTLDDEWGQAVTAVVVRRRSRRRSTSCREAVKEALPPTARRRSCSSTRSPRTALGKVRRASFAAPAVDRGGGATPAPPSIT